MAAVHPRHLLPSARERIDHIAYELFSRHGVRSVGVDVVVARSGVAKKTLYSHYPSKEKLALAFLQRREELWERTWLQEGVKRRARRPADRLLAIFDVFDSWFRRSDFEGCAFIKVLLEHDDPAHPIRRSTEDYMRGIEPYLRIAPDMGSCGTAAFLRQPVYTRDTATDPLWENCNEIAVRNGLRAIWSTPILSDVNGVLGTFAMYYGEPRFPAEEHIQLINMATQMARVAIEGKCEDEILRTAFVDAPSGMFITDLAGNVVRA